MEQVLGKQDNCQMVVTLSLANVVLSVPAAYRRYLPEEWAKQRTNAVANLSRQFVAAGDGHTIDTH